MNLSYSSIVTKKTSKIRKYIKENGFFEFVILLLKKIDKVIKKPMYLVIYVKRLKLLAYKVNFFLEGDVELRVPQVKYSNILSSRGRMLIYNTYIFSSRPNKEALLRKIIYDLFCEGYIESHKSVIDIGSWLSDNAIIWAKMLTQQGVVYAVDPSQSNLNFGKKLATLNSVENVLWNQAVYSDQPGVSLGFNGNISHASFHESMRNAGDTILSTTLDEIVPKDFHDTISLLHVDVEGFEKKVLYGSKMIIDKSRPVIIFEQHISREDPSLIISFLKDKNYNIFMVNEVLPDCYLDCRNFIALDGTKPLPATIFSIKHHCGAKKHIWYASLGEALIK